MNFDKLVESHGFTYRNLATLADMSVQQLYNYANGKVLPEKVSFWSVWNISQALDVDPCLVYQSIIKSWKVHGRSE